MKNKIKLTERQIRNRRNARNGWILGLSVVVLMVFLCSLAK